MHSIHISTLNILLVIGILLVLGAINWYIGRSPVEDADFKALIKWVLLGIGVIVVIFFVLSLFGAGPILTIN